MTRRAPAGQLEVQYAIARAFAEAERVADVADMMLTTLSDALGWEAAALWLPDTRGEVLCCEAVVTGRHNLEVWAEQTCATSFRRGEGLPGRVWTENRPIWVRDTVGEPNFARRAVAERVGLRHALAFPIRVRSSVGAVVELFASAVREVDLDQIHFVEAVAHQMGSFLERVGARQAVVLSEAHKAGILQAAVDAIVSADADGRIVDFNAAAERMFGWPAAEVIGRRIADLLVPESLRADHVAGLGRYVATGVPRILGQRVRTTAARADGTTLPVELTVTEVKLEDRSLFTAFIRDISAERESEIARERFLEILSHELRTPVTAIYGGATLLARPALADDSRHELLKDVGAEADRLHRLVEDLIVLARAERGAHEVTLAPVHLDRVVEREVAAVRSRTPAVEFVLDSIGDRHAVEGDETYIEQVLRNLLSNSAKYAAAGRRVDVRIEHDDGESTVRVLDRGPGIEQAEAARLFDIDYRSPLTDGLAQGSGIGLFVARWLIEAMHGRIWAVPRPGGGSEFGFTLRAVDDDGGPVEGRSPRLLAAESPSSD